MTELQNLLVQRLDLTNQLLRQTNELCRCYERQISELVAINQLLRNKVAVGLAGGEFTSILSNPAYEQPAFPSSGDDMEEPKPNQNEPTID